MSQQHYALVSKHSSPLKLEDEENEATLTDQSSKDVRQELVQIYETYAALYPNPKLIEERRQRDTLLQATRAATTFQQQQQPKKKKRGGIFSFFLGGGDEESEADQTQQPQQQQQLPSSDIDDALLSYTDTVNPLDDGKLCATQQSLDTSCIPEEVYSVARFHLTSTKTRRTHPNALRGGPVESQASMYIVVGLGEIAVFDQSESYVTITSDRDELQGYAERSNEFELHAVRGAVISPNCIAVSWGFLDGIIVVYRRVQVPNYLQGHGWEAVWMFGPSASVLENLPDLFHDDQDQPGSPLLRITDCVPLSVQVGASNGLEEHEQQPTNRVVTLAISRLGGYIELLPLPTRLWAGPVLTLDNFRLPKHKMRQPNNSSPKRKRQSPQRHYALGKNIACPPETVAVTTLDYHTDIQALDAFRTSVNSETAWDDQAFPDAPPAEFVVAASGISKQNGTHDVITFWTVSTLFPEASSPNDDIGFTLHSSLIEAVTANTGSAVSVFASPEIMQQWRTPRQVKLKEGAAINGSRDDSSPPPQTTRVTTLSTSAPVVSLRFSESDGSTSTYSGPFLSVLDWNGEVQIFNCSVMGRVAAQNLPLHEYEAYRNSMQALEDAQPVSFPLVEAIVPRNHFPGALQSLATSSVGNHQWLGSGGFGSEGTMPPLALLMDGLRKLVLLTFVLPPEDAYDHGPLDSSLLSLPFPTLGAAIENLDGTNLSFVTIQKGYSKPSRRKARLLTHFVMDQLQPIAIVETLARDAKYEEAIESASKLSNHEQTALEDVVGLCRRKVWETKRDIRSLEATGDASYILQQALSVRDEDFDTENISMDTLHSLLKLALTWGERSKNGSKVDAIRVMIVRLGSYELLCHHFGTDASVHQYLSEFTKIDVDKLSEQLARRADIRALSVLLFRHRKEIGPRLFTILSLLPPSLDTIFYCHLLPVLRNGSISDYFLSDNGKDAIPWSHMPQYLSETEGYSVVMGLLDEKAVLDFNKSSISKDSKNFETVIADWFLCRAKLTQTFVGDIEIVVRLCELGLKCLTPLDIKSNFDLIGTDVEKVYQSWQSAISLQRMILDEVVSIDGDGIDTDDLMEMDLTQLLALILNSETNSSRIKYRFKEYIHPLILTTSSTRNANDQNLDLALASHCACQVSKCRDSPVSEVKTILASCNAIAECSRSTIPKQDRLIKEISVLIEMVIKSSTEILDSLSVQSVEIADQRDILEGLWSLYETLPFRLPEETSNDEALIQTFYGDLVFVDTLSRWPGINPFSINQTLKKTSTTELLSESRKEVIISLINSFSDVLSRVDRDSDKHSLLKDLLSDVETINNISFEQSIDVAEILCMHIIPGFLTEGDFELVATYLRWTGPSVDSTVVQRMVIDYADETVFAESDDTTKVTLAIRCQDVLGPLLPEAEAKFQSIRRFLDASHFISTVLFDERDVRQLSPLVLKEMSGLDGVETVLQSVPESVVCGCTQWKDEVFAMESNRVLRNASSTKDISEAESLFGELPPLPGGAIFHLATILSLEDREAVVAVKSRVVHYAVECRFYGAAAAVARTLMNDVESGSGSSDSMDLAKLGAIAEVVVEEAYQDLLTKKELCEGALSHFGTSLTATASDSFTKILHSSAALDVTTSRFNLEFLQLSEARKQTLLSRPLARLYKHIFYEYKSDVHVLFLDLVQQAEHQQVHDSLMNALSRFVFYWCIHDAKTLKRFVDLWDVADAHDNLALGCSLLLQIPSKLTATNCIRELQKIAADQAANVATVERFGANSFCEADPQLVRRLVDRGYGENAARRAVVMTCNSGYDDALGWAVMHTMDPDFNEILAITKPVDKLYIDDDAIQLLQRSLHHVEKILEDPPSRSALIRYIEDQHQDNASSQSRVEPASTKQPPPPRSTNGRLSSEIQQPTQKIASPHAPDKKTTNGVPSSTSRLRQQILAKIATETTPEQRVLQNTVPPRPSAPPKPKEPTPKVTKPPTQTNGDSTRTNAVASKSGSNVASYSDLDREELRKRGQEALEKLRGKTRDSNRSRLIAEGRLLLKQSRSTTTKTAPFVNENGHIQSQALPPALPAKPVAAPSTAVARMVPPPPSKRIPASLTASKPKPVSHRVATKVTKVDTTEDTANDDDGWDFDDF